MKKILKHTLFIAVFAILLTGFGFQMKEADAASLNRTSVTMVKGKTYTLKASGKVKKAKSSDERVVKIQKTKGKEVSLKAKKKGTATVRVKVGSKSLKCQVKVVRASLNKTSVSKNITKGSTGKVTLKVTGRKPRKWKSSNTKVASVKQNGKSCTVKLKKKGSATITAYVGQSKLKCKVKVKYWSDKLTLTDTGIIVNPNDPSNYKVIDYQTAGKKTIQKYLKKIPEFKKFSNQYLKAGMTDAEKMSAMVRFEYDQGWGYGDPKPNEYPNFLSMESQFASSLLLYGKAVCAGWAEMQVHLCFLADIPCFEVVSLSADHAWNYVKLDGKWYSVDFTPSGSSPKTRVMLKGRDVVSYFADPSDALAGNRLYKRWVSKLPKLRKLGGNGTRYIGQTYWTDEKSVSHYTFSDWY